MGAHAVVAATTYESVEKRAWGFVETLDIPGTARRAEVTKAITDAVCTALMAGEIEAREQALGRRALYAPPAAPPQPSTAEVVQAELRRFLDEDLPRQLQQIIGPHIRIGISQALEAGARSARVDRSTAEEENRVHLASSPAVESAAARMQRLEMERGTAARVIGPDPLIAARN
jgi:hypothetical protein